MFMKKSLIKFFWVEGIYQAFGLSKPQILISTLTLERKKTLIVSF